MNLAGFLGAIGGAIPLIETIVDGVESLFGHGNGETKLQAATSSALAALQIFAQVQGKTLPANFQADLQAAINAVVTVKNDLGLLLPHGAQTAA